MLYSVLGASSAENRPPAPGVARRPLDRRGTGAMRVAWLAARDRLSEEYGAMTVGELMARFSEGSEHQN